MEWACGITTIPQRRTTLLRRTVISLDNAGFELGTVRRFIDGYDNPTIVPDSAAIRTQPIGCVGNWVLGLIELVIRHPTADWFVMFQDDLVAVLNLKSYLTQCRLPKNAYLNLFTVPRNAQSGQAGVKDVCGRWFAAPEPGRGALALAFPASAVRALLASPRLTNQLFDTKPIADFRRDRYRDHTPPIGLTNGMVNLDGMVYESLIDSGFREYCHRPSMVEHTGGSDSAMGHDKCANAHDFPGEYFDALRWLE